jgi:phosphoesterase RecJ-like protein
MAPHSFDPRYPATMAAFRQAKGVIVVAHRRPDGDSLGAAAAMLAVCEGMGIPAAGFCVDRPLAQYQFLPGVTRFTQDTGVFADPRYDTVAVFDSGDYVHAGLQDAGSSERKVRPSHRLIVADHHATNTRFGHVNLVDESAASTTDVVYRMCVESGVALTPSIATCLLAGLLTDTGNLTNMATTAGAFASASALLAAGGRLRETGSRLERNKHAGALRVWGRALSRLKWHAATGVASTALFLEDLAAEGVGDDVAEGLSNVLGGYLDVPVVLVLRELAGGKVKASFRTPREIDVASVASALGGGGHKKAAGAIMAGKIVEERDRWTVSRA